MSTISAADGHCGGRPLSTDSESGCTLFQPVRIARTSQLVADQIRELIRDRRLRPGDRLPAERMLSQVLGTSRTTIHQALQLLQFDDLVHVTSGATGGAVVAQPSVEVLARRMAGLADTVSPDQDLVEARRAVELSILPVAIRRADATDVAELTQLAQQHLRARVIGGYAMAMSMRFHRRVAECTHNRGLELVAACFHGPVLTERRWSGVSDRDRHDGAAAHHDLATAIADRDAASASRIMQAHLDRL